MTGKSFKKQNDIGLAAFNQSARLMKTKTKVEQAKKASETRKAAAVKIQAKAKF